jgi:hypothetical protein
MRISTWAGLPPTTAFGPGLPFAARKKVRSYMGYSCRDINVVAATALDPDPTSARTLANPKSGPGIAGGGVVGEIGRKRHVLPRIEFGGAGQ